MKKEKAAASSMRGSCYNNTVILKVNGKRVALNPFLQGFMKETVFGMLKSLKGVKKPREVELIIKGTSAHKMCQNSLRPPSGTS